MSGDDVHIHEQTLPGIGRRFDITLDDAETLVVVTRRDGSRVLSLRRDGADAPERSVHISRRHAAALGSLLLGARFTDESALDGNAPERAGVS